MRNLFVAGAHTDVGKTHVACCLLRAARARGLAVDALKPLVSGFDPDDWTDSDPGRLLAALDRPLTPAALEAISPWRYRAPLAPPMAARLEGASIDLAKVIDYCRDGMRASGADLMLVEGVGGVMSPLSETETGLDLMTELRIPNIVVSGSYLGAISHALTAVETLRTRGMTPLAVVLSQSAETDGQTYFDTHMSLVRLLPMPVIVAPRTQDHAWADAALTALSQRSVLVEGPTGRGEGQHAHPDQG